MITRKLQSELLKNGFPCNSEAMHLHKDGVICLSPDCTAEGWVSEPSLSKLILACGEEFAELRKCKVFQDSRRDPKIWGAVHRFSTTGDPSELYESPEEAVANLWLKLFRNFKRPLKNVE